MARKNKILAGALFWGVSNLFAYHKLKHDCLKHIDGLNNQIDVLLEINAAFASSLTPEQLEATLKKAPHDPEFIAYLNNQ